MLWATIQFGADESSIPTTVVPAEEVTDEAAADDNEPEAVAAGPAVITDASAYDPDGDGTENDDLAVQALAGDPSTAWNTVCYSSQFMGGKQGVGVVVSFEELASSPLSVEVLNAPYQIQFYASAQQQIPRTIDAWGAPLSAEAGQEASTVVSATPAAPARHMLVLLNEIGPDSTCTAANPYRGALNEIRVAN